MWSLDHVFVMTSPDAPEAAALEAGGFSIGGRAEHKGQGTANCWFPFANAYLELLYATDEAELRAPLVQPTGLYERSRWRTIGGSPVGVCLRGDGELPVPTWEYAAAYLPPGKSIPIAFENAGPRAPMRFFNTNTTPGRAPGGEKRSITAVRIQTPVIPSWWDPSRRLADFLCIEPGARHSVVIELDGAMAGRELRAGDDSPLSIRW
jgi:hypothetical protein